MGLVDVDQVDDAEGPGAKFFHYRILIDSFLAEMVDATDEIIAKSHFVSILFANLSLQVLHHFVLISPLVKRAKRGAARRKFFLFILSLCHIK